MIIHSMRNTTGADAGPRRPSRTGRTLSACLATLVLALATGVPLRSAEHLLPHPGEQPAPYLGV